MSFAFHPDDRPVRSGFRRIARAELKAALRILHAADPVSGPAPQAVHELRKHTKKLRGLLRLVRPVFPGFAATNLALRDGARHLADLRDAEVRLATLGRIAAGLPGGAAPAWAAERLAAEIAPLRAPERMVALTDRLAGELARLRRDARDWDLTAGGWRALEPGLRRTWRAARRQHEAAALAFRRGGDAAPFHEWRKSVKHHWYQARLLAPIWPAMMAPHIQAADALGEDLGDHNDIDLLLSYLRGHPDRDLAGLAAEGRFHHAACAARRALARRALRQGAWLLAEPEAALARRWQCWWRLWRKAGAGNRP